jgi:hypothetical protein
MRTKFAQLIVFIFILLCSFGVVGQEDVKIMTQTSIDKVETVIKSGVTYKLHSGSRGGKYIIRTSLKSGNKYKQYLKKEDIEKLIAAVK